MAPVPYDEDHPATLTTTQVAEILGSTPDTVRKWRERYDDFPEPVGASKHGSPLYRLATIRDWAANNGMLPVPGEPRRGPGRPKKKV